MALLNKNYGIVIYISLVLLFLSVVAYYFLYKKQKDYYVIKTFDVKTIQLNGDSIRGYTISPLKVESKKNAWGISVKMLKEYVSGEDSPRKLFCSSIEPGINGIKSKINHFNLIYKQENKTIILNDSLIAKEYDLAKLNTSGDAINHLYRVGVSFSQFIADINNNAEYTKGISLNNFEIYFWYKNISDSILYKPNKKLLVDIKIEDLQIKKTLISK